jgi:hypothetical protein
MKVEVACHYPNCSQTTIVQPARAKKGLGFYCEYHWNNRQHNWNMVPLSKRPHYVYLISNEEKDAGKVGYTTNINRRPIQIGKGWKVVDAVKVPNQATARTIEKLLLGRLDTRGYTTIKGRGVSAETFHWSKEDTVWLQQDLHRLAEVYCDAANRSAQGEVQQTD